MPCKSPEAIQRKAERKKERRQAAKPKLPPSDLPSYKIAARRMLPRLPEMSKAELRDMLVQAFANTAK